MNLASNKSLSRPKWTPAHTRNVSIIIWMRRSRRCFTLDKCLNVSTSLLLSVTWLKVLPPPFCKQYSGSFTPYAKGRFAVRLFLLFFKLIILKHGLLAIEKYWEHTKTYVCKDDCVLTCDKLQYLNKVAVRKVRMKQYARPEGVSPS